MKFRKVIYLLFLFLFGCSFTSVYAANYEMKELIPLNVKTTITTNKLSYRQFYYSYSDEDSTNNHILYFDSIKNLSDEDLPISITVALFDRNKKNISVVNYCDSDKLKGKEEVPFKIQFKNTDVPDDRSLDEVHYYAVWDINENCHTDVVFDFVGRPPEKVGVILDNSVDEKTKLFARIMLLVAGFIVLLFLYKFLFTNSYNNMNGDDVRRGYDDLNDDLKAQREYDAIHNPPPEKEVKKPKTDEVLRQEQEEAAKANQDASDLHNFYK